MKSYSIPWYYNYVRQSYKKTISVSRMDKNHFMQRKTWRHLWKVHLSVSGNQPNSLKSCSELTSLILRLRIIRAPHFCNLNRLSKYVLSELDQTIILQYSYKGWTIELCKYLQTSILINFLILLKSPSLDETFKAIVSMCPCQFKFE